MKRFFWSIFFLSFSTWVFSQNAQLFLDNERHLLMLNNHLLPPWLKHIININQPEDQYAFIQKASLAYPIEGWHKVSKSIQYSKTFPRQDKNEIPSKFIQQGWFYTTSLPHQNLSDWFYAPQYHLFFNQEGIFKLDRFFEQHLESITSFRIDQPNETSLYEFYRIIVQPSENILKVEPLFPSNWTLAYYKRIPIASGKMIFVVTPIAKPKSPESDPQLLKLKVIYKNQKPVNIVYKVFFSLKSQLLG